MSIPSLTSLLKQSHITDHEEVLRAVSESLKNNKNDVKAQHVKVIALLKLDRFEDAARAIETGDVTLKEQAKLEYAYALYKTGRRKEAAQIARGAKERGLQHVEAQALYGLEAFVEASDLYKLLSQDAHGDNIADLRVNTLAVNAQLEWNQLGQHVEDKIMTREDFEAHETVYNTACISIARGELGQCEVLLKRAKQLCENLQDLSEEEKASEMLPIDIQHIFLLIRLGRLNEAQDIAKNIDISKISDAFTAYLAKVNTQAAQGETGNPYLLQEQIDSTPDAFEPGQAFGFQKATITRNGYALGLGAMKFDGIATATQKTLSKHTGSSISPALNSLSVVNAAAHSRNKTGKDALRHILLLLEKRPDEIGLVLTAVQTYISSNNSASAVELLEKLAARLEQSGDAATQEVRFAPGLIGSLISLYTSQGRSEQARLEFVKVGKYWRSKGAEKLTPGVVHFLKAAGSALLASTQKEDIDEAKAIFDALIVRDARDKYAAAGAIAATSSAESGNDRTELTSLDKLISNIDVDALERAGIPQRAKSNTEQVVTSKKRAAEGEAEKPKVKKIRKSKMPRDYDPSKTPDPEGWLPLRDRSTYRPKGKKSKAKQAMLSQGAVGNDSDGSRPATPGGEVMKAKPTQGGNNNKKKKSKGKK